MPFYEKGDVRIHYEEVGSGLPLLIIPGGGLNSTIAGLDPTHPFNAMKEFAKTGSAASAPTCATPMAASRPARSTSSAPGTASPTTMSA